jgi:E3 ubiquitin-protein ligase BRE1
MREIRREKALLELQLADNEKRAKFHDEHLRLIDAWLMQVSLGAHLLSFISDQTGRLTSLRLSITSN